MIQSPSSSPWVFAGCSDVNQMSSTSPEHLNQCFLVGCLKRIRRCGLARSMPLEVGFKVSKDLSFLKSVLPAVCLWVEM